VLLASSCAVFLRVSCGRVIEHSWAHPIYCVQPPRQSNQSDCRVDVKAELSRRTACTSQDRNQAIYASDLVEKLKKGPFRFSFVCSRSLASVTYSKEQSEKYACFQVQAAEERGERTRLPLWSQREFHRHRRGRRRRGASLLNNICDVLILKSPTTISLPRKRLSREGHPPDDRHDVREIQAKTVGR